MKIWWVLGWDQYYPTYDNFKASFETFEEANEYVENIKKSDGYYYIQDHYEIINIEDRL